MKMAHDFAAARPAALHCAELTAHSLGRGPRPEERAGLMAVWRRDLARVLAEDLSGLLSGDRLDVDVSEPEALSGEAALARIGAVAANCLLRCGVSGETALLSLDFATAIALTDRSFGGDGKPTAGMPEQLPRSAALLVEEAAAMIAQAITRVSHGDAPPSIGLSSGLHMGGEVIVRSESAARLKPFAPDAACLVFSLLVANRHGCAWRATLAIAAERFDRLLPGLGGTPRARRAGRTRASGMAAPFAAIPLPLHVVVAEFDLSLTRLQALAPGDCIPLAMGRQVPLMVGHKVLGYGSIGTSDDRMAIRLTRIPLTNPVPASAEGVAP